MTQHHTTLTPQLQQQAVTLGADIRRQRTQLKVSTVAAAQSAGLSRMTWHRIEKGEASVSFGAYLQAAYVVGLKWRLAKAADEPLEAGTIPVRIALNDYPQLKQLAWQVTGVDSLTPVEALDIYQRNWRYLDEAALDIKEKALIEALRQALVSHHV